MSFQSMLNHKCDVYHIRNENTSPGYGLPASPSFEYGETPDLTDVPCHFNIKGSAGSRNIVQTPPLSAPNANYQAKIKLVLPLGTDIRLNDKIVDKSDGCEYTADKPIPIRSHHMFVMLRRTVSQEPIGVVDNGSG